MLRNPPNSPLIIDDPDLLLGIQLFFNMSESAAQDVYTKTLVAIQTRHPDSQLPSFDKIKRQVESLSGITPIIHDMCINSCLAFTGPFQRLQVCPDCHEPRYKEGTLVARQTFCTLPVGPQIQALYRHEGSAKEMKYRRNKTDNLLAGPGLSVYNDYITGQEYLKAVQEGRILPTDTVLMYSLDGAQLYRNKTSDFWI